MPQQLELFLLAWPAGHSVSPLMQNAACAANDFPARYSAWEVAPRDLPAAVRRLRDPDVLGANVTIPHKQAVLPLLDELTPAAQAIGAVNTISNRGGRLLGDNTDAGGFLAALAETGFSPRSSQVVLLGAGGAARAVLYALLGSGASVRVANRTEAKAAQLAAEFSSEGRVSSVGPDELPEAVAACDLLVNSTSVGMATPDAENSGRASPLPAGTLPRRGLVVDLIYRPALTLLLERAKAAGLPVQNGLPMLIQQGAQAFTIWTGQPAPIDVMRAAVESVFAAGDGGEQSE